MVVRFGYETSPNMMGIQEGYNKNFHIKSIEYYEKFDSLHIVLRYKDGNIRVMLVDVIVNLRNTCVEVCKSRSMHVW